MTNQAGESMLRLDFDAPERIYKPRRGLNDISVLSKSSYGRSLIRNRAVNLANAGLTSVAN